MSCSAGCRIESAERIPTPERLKSRFALSLESGAEAPTGTPGPGAQSSASTAARRRSCRPGARRSSGSSAVLRRGPGLAFLEVRYRIVAAGFRRLRRGRRAAIEAALASGAKKVALLAFSMGGAVAVRNAAAPEVSLVAGVNPWLPPELELTPLVGRRLAIVHGAPTHPARAPGREALAVAGGLRPSTSARRRREQSHGSGRAARGRAAAPERRFVRRPGRQVRRARRRRAGAILRVGLYKTLWRARTYVAARLLYRLELVGRVPPGPCVVAANHESVLDLPLLALAAEQPLHFLAKVEPGAIGPAPG